MRIQICMGIALVAAGLGAITGALMPLRDFSYPLTWWGVLLLIDSWNLSRWGTAPINGNTRHFVAVTVPLSVLFWLMYELFNLRFPQWRYEGEPDSAWVQMIFGFVAYATVIPIIVEVQWLLAGPAARWCLPRWLDRSVRRKPLAFMAAGVLLLAIPVFVQSFWMDQLMWIAPAILAAPFLSVQASDNRDPRSAFAFACSVALAAVLGGFLWELFNYWSATKWIYLIMADAPHLFEMPVAGYLGFVPFGFSTVAVYAWQRRVPARIAIAAGLYASAFAVLYIFVKWYESVFWTAALAKHP